MQFTSSAFTHNGDIPQAHTCEGQDTSPPLAIEDAPEGTQSFALIMDDPDAPDPKAPKMVWDHWVVWNIPVETREIPANTRPGVIGRNSWGKNEYGGPCPPVGKHRYFFTLYALDCELKLNPNADKKDLLAAMDGHILEQAELIGLYEK